MALHNCSIHCVRRGHIILVYQLAPRSQTNAAIVGYISWLFAKLRFVKCAAQCFLLGGGDYLGNDCVQYMKLL